MPSRVVTATYRLQLTKDFPFARARELVPYLHDLGVSHLYLSPVLAAKPGSTHGYDVIDHTRINPELGTEDELRALASDLHARDMGIILDVVPNHMSASAYNPYWDNVLERGPASRYASWFDIDWDAPAAKGKVVLPVLGDEIGKVIARGELTVDARDRGMRVKYFDRTFPLDASTLPRELQLAHLDPAAMSAATEWMAGAPGRRRLRALLDAQHYSLRFWRRARTDINYRRFFDVNDLVALRMETDEIFDATHALILRLVHAGVVDGLRVDHVDGLRDPAWYLMKLRAAVNAVRHADGPETVPIVVEKILGGDEQLPATWPVMGTTGYDFMTDVEELFVVPDGFARIEAAYRTLRRDSTLNFREAARDGKRRALRGALWPDVLRLARVAQRWKAAVPQDAIADAIVELIVHLEPYRTYIAEPGVVSDADRAHLDRAFKDAKKTARADPKVLDVLRRAFLGKPSASDTGRAELVARFQQTSGPAAAKGVEDTALYVYLPLASRNEVGASPDRPLADVVTRVHARNALRGRDWPRTLLATNTHDTKRSADVRARIDALTAVPDEWVRDVARWRRLNLRHKRVAHGKPAPDANSEYLYYQSLLGLWPAPSGDRGADDLPSREWMDAARQRLVAYMAKAAREAKTRTSWVDRDEAFEKALDDFVRQSMDPTQSAEFLSDVARLTARVASNGFHFALARVLLHCAAPGIPDVYQGDELWNFALVDPDNRRPVDFARRRQLLAQIDRDDPLGRVFLGPGADLGDMVKLALLARLLRFRRDHRSLFLDGGYEPLSLVAAPAGLGIFAFVRRTRSEACIALARTRPLAEGLADTMQQSQPVSAALAGRWRSVLSDRVVELRRSRAGLTVDVGSLIPATQPCELLFFDGR